MLALVASLRSGEWLSPFLITRLAVVWALATPIIFGVDLLSYLHDGLTNQAGQPVGADVLNFWAGASLAWSGEFDRVYDLHSFQEFEKQIVGPNLAPHLYSYPPTLLLLTAPLSLFAYFPAIAVFHLTGLAIFMAALRPIFGWKIAVVLAIAPPAVLMTLTSGQNGLYTAALFGGGLYLLDRRPYLAGVLFGILTFKPQLGILIPIALLTNWRWRTIVAASLTTILLVLLSVTFFDVQIWFKYLENVSIVSFVKEVEAANWPRMVPVFPWVRLIGGGVWLSYFVQGLVLCIVAIGVISIWRSRCSQAIKNATLIVGSLLASPYIWDYDYVIMVFAMLWRVKAAQDTGFLPWEKTLWFVLITLPLFGGLVTKYTLIGVFPLTLTIAFAMLFCIGRSESRLNRAESDQPTAEASSSIGCYTKSR